MTGFQKAKEKAEALAKEKAEKANHETKLQTQFDKQREEKALAVIDLSKYTKLGMKNIDASDIRPPVMFLVQGNMDKAEIVDKDGKECPNGKYFLKGSNEILDSIDAYIIWLKKDKYQTEGKAKKWNGSDMFRVIAVKKDDLMPFAINFSKTSRWAISDLLTAATSQNKPMFAFNVSIKIMEDVGNGGDKYFRSVVSVGNIEDDPKILHRLIELSTAFDMRTDVQTEEESEEDDATRKRAEAIFAKDEPQPQEPSKEEVDVNGIPF